ncbi:DUF1857-domain-containing protein [Colletotrichum caudatum]|nr:DUF1857-domain-containing protein [Colletotrichum caudatum]
MSDAKKSFSYNVFYTIAANQGADEAEKLTLSELWQGVRRGARYPGDFGPFVRSCEVTSGNSAKFVRVIDIGDGAVHINDGTKIVQDVVVQKNLLVSATTRDTGARTTMVCSYGIGASDEDDDMRPHLTLYYELLMGDKAPEPGSVEARDIMTNYRGLAKNMVAESIKTIRGWKLEGKLARWAEEEENGVW